MGEVGGEMELDYQAISIVLKDEQNRSLTGTLNFTVWQQATEEEEEYDQEGAAYYVVAVILVYGLSMVLLIGSLAKKKMGDKGQEMEENQLHRFLEQMPDLREQNARDNYRQLKQDIRALVNKDSTATTTSSIGTPTSPPPPPNVSTASMRSQPQPPPPPNRKAVSFNEGETLAKDASGGKLVVGCKVGDSDRARDGEGEKEYLLTVNKMVSDDSASSLLDHSVNSTTGLLSKDQKAGGSGGGGGMTPEVLPREKYDGLKNWHIDNPSDIWVSYEPPETEEQRKRVEERIPLGYSPGRSHKDYTNGSSLPHSPTSPSVGGRDTVVSISQPTSPQKSATLRTYMVPLRQEQAQIAYPPRDRPRSYATPPNNQLFAPFNEHAQGPPQQFFPQPRKSWSPGQSPEALLPSEQIPRLPPSPRSRNTAFPAFQPPSPNARRLAAGGGSPVRSRAHPPLSQAMAPVSPAGSPPLHQSRRRRSPSPRSRSRSRGRSQSPNVIGGRHVTSDIADAVRSMADANKTSSSKEDLMQVTCL